MEDMKSKKREHVYLVGHGNQMDENGELRISKNKMKSNFFLFFIFKFLIAPAVYDI